MTNKLNKFSKKLNVQLIAEVFKQYGIAHIVLSPGSRNGALATHFSHHPDFKTYSITDERSAGFVALGMAQQLRKPVVICCTSGSAAANYYPAITEAFYQNIPLIVLTADRPENLVDNFDGQTIRQKNLYQLHSYFNTQLPEDESAESLTINLNQIKKAVLNCLRHSGPVHINMPFSEPLYEFQEEIDIHFEQFEKSEILRNSAEFDVDEFAKKWNDSSKKLILTGLQFPDKALNEWIEKLAQDDSVIVMTETTSNLHSLRFFNKIDSVIYSLTEEELENLKPEILLTVGQNVVSKKIKTFIRNHKPVEHWHLDAYWHPDTFHCLTEKIESTPNAFFEKFVPLIKKQDSTYFENWNSIRTEKEQKQLEFSQKTGFSDFKVFEKLIATFPKDARIHYGNSSAIRYAQLFDHAESNAVFCNRGTSGIDGATSTAAGASMVSEQQTLLITGDIAFFYDINGLWNNYLPKNFKIIVINNGGGNIFKIIPGPYQTGVMDSVFVTEHQMTAEFPAKTYGFEYISVNNLEELADKINAFYTPSNHPKIMEINTSKVKNEEVMRAYFRIQ